MSEEKKKVSGFRGGDANINRAGRPKSNPEDKDKPTNRQLKERELLMLLRKFKPHISDAILAATKIMGNNEASHQNQLKAATIILDNYRKLTLDLYGDADPEEAGEEIQQQNAPVFSLKVIENKD